MGIFMICAQAVVHFRPKESYEKYLKLLVSVMVLIQVFLPIGSFLLGEGRQNAANALEQFGRELEQSLQDASGDAAAADELLEKMTLEEVMRRLEEQEGEAQGTSPEETGPQEGMQGEDSGQGLEVEIGTEPIEPVSIEPIGPVQDSTQEQER